jgi:hypothetical protein
MYTYSHHFASHGLVSSLVRGFAWSVGWMIARGLGLPAAGAVLVLLLVGAWWRSRRRRRLRPVFYPSNDMHGV